MAFLLDEVVRVWANHAAIVLLHAVQAEAPKVTGTFAASMYPTVRVLDGNVTLRISASSGKPKAIWVRNGTMQHAIGTEGAFLFNPNDDGISALGPVIHPGTRPNQFGLRAINMVRTQLLASLSEEIMTAMADAVAELRK